MTQMEEADLVIIGAGTASTNLVRQCRLTRVSRVEWAVYRENVPGRESTDEAHCSRKSSNRWRSMGQRETIPRSEDQQYAWIYCI